MWRMSSAHWRRWAIVVRGTVIAGVLLACCPAALALNPALDINQYVHTAWRVRDGFLKGTPQAIAQTLDGVLWLGTDAGLFRFDGVRATAWTPPNGQELPSTNIRHLLGSRDGSLWIATLRGLSRWDGRRLTHDAGLNGKQVSTLLEDREGTLWALVVANARWTLCQIRQGKTECSGQDGGPGAGAIGLFEDRQGTLWVGTSNGLWQWKPGPRKLFPLPKQPSGIQALADADDDGLLVSFAGAIRRLADGRMETVFSLPASAEGRQLLLRDRDGGLWIGTSVGLLHLHEGVSDAFMQTDGLSGNYVFRLFEDREGSIWVVTTEGIDRFRDPAVATWSTKQGLSHAVVLSIDAPGDGSVWLGSSNGVNRIRNLEVAVYGRRRAARLASGDRLGSRTGHDVDGSALPDSTVQSIFRDSLGRMWVSTRLAVGYYEGGRFVVVPSLPGGQTRAIAEDSGGFWVANQDAGLFRVSPDLTRVRRTPWAVLGRNDIPTAMTVDPGKGGVWVGFFQGGITYVGDNGIGASYGESEGLPAGFVRGLRFDTEGTFWIATDNGLSRLKSGRLATLTSRNGLPCDGVQWALKDDDRSLWLGTGCGLVRIARADIDDWEAAADSATAPTRPGSEHRVRRHRRSPAWHVFGVYVASRQVRRWTIVVRCHRWRWRGRSSTPSLQHESAADLRRTGDCRSSDVRGGSRRRPTHAVAGADARTPNRLHGVQHGCAGQGALPVHARGL